VSALPTYLDLDRNQQAEFCVWRDGHPFAHDGSDDCVLAWAAVAERFLLYFAFVGGALLGPFGLYLVLLAVKMMLLNSGRSGRNSTRKPAAVIAAPTSIVCHRAGNLSADAAYPRGRPRLRAKS